MSTRKSKPRIYMGDRGFWKVTLASKPNGAPAYQHHKRWSLAHDFTRELNFRMVARRKAALSKLPL